MKELKLYENKVDVDKLSKFELAFLQAIVDEGERQFNDCCEENEVLEDFVSNNTFTFRCLDDDGVNVSLELAKDIANVFDVEKFDEQNINTFAGDILCDLLFGSDYYYNYVKELNEKQKDFIDKKRSRIYFTPVIDISIYDDVRVFCE